jgi:hypothetical protein
MIQPKTITLVRAEGLIAECDRPETAKTWAHANALFRWSRTAPEHGGYDKCDFTIIFEDGYEYKGRYDLMHYRREHPDLARHVRSFMRYLAGELPEWCVEQKDIERVRRHQQSLGEESKREAVAWLETHDCGQAVKS